MVTLGGTFGSANWSDGGYSFGSDYTTIICGFNGGNSNTQSGFTGGGYVGANYQFSQFVIGLEGEFGYSGINSNGTNFAGHVA